ncbi:MAG TPA: hypothetical protein EYQ20_08540 [candidate division Zixibacteria bacterium]|nr:hypothetical protein [candidate division Zixibacteria bacterium]
MHTAHCLPSTSYRLLPALHVWIIRIEAHDGLIGRGGQMVQLSLFKHLGQSEVSFYKVGIDPDGLMQGLLSQFQTILA